MANTYTKIYLHVVFAVKHRNALLPADHLQEVHAYLGGIFRRLGHIPIAIGGIEDHVHCLILYNKNQLIKDTMREVKASSSTHINHERYYPYKFEWQRGYSVFSISEPHVPAVIDYIEHQFEHHRNTTLEDEAKRLLEIHQIEYDIKYILKSPTDESREDSVAPTEL